RFVSLLKFEIFCCWSSSKTLKSSLGRLVMNLPLLSDTVNNTFTRSTLTDSVCCCCCCCWATSLGAPKAARAEHTNSAKRKRVRFMGVYYRLSIQMKNEN